MRSDAQRAWIGSSMRAALFVQEGLCQRSRPAMLGGWRLQLTGSQFAITFNSYRTQVEVIQRGLAPFGQSATPGARRQPRADTTTIERAFRRDYTISVATSFH